MASIFIEREVRSYPSIQYSHPGLTQHLIKGATDHSSSVDPPGRAQQHQQHQQQNGSGEQGQSRELRRSVSDETLHLKAETHSTNWKARNKTTKPAAGDGSTAAQHRTVARLVRADSLSTSCPDLSQQHITHGVRRKPLVATNNVDAVNHSQVQVRHHPEERTSRFPAVTSRQQLQTSHQTVQPPSTAVTSSVRQEHQLTVAHNNKQQLTPSPLARRKLVAPGHVTDSDRKHNQKASDDAPARSSNIKSHVVVSASPSRHDARPAGSCSPQRPRPAASKPSTQPPQQRTTMTSPQRQRQPTPPRKAGAASTQRQTMIQQQNYVQDEEDLYDDVFE